MLLKDESVNVVKKAILTLTQLYKVTLQVKPELKKKKTRHQTVLWKSIILSPTPSLPRQWLVRSKAVSERQEACWDLVTQMKGDVLALLDSENDGVRTHAIKFTESLIVTLSPRTSDSDVPKRQENDISLDKVPKDHSYIRSGRELLFFLLVFLVTFFTRRKNKNVFIVLKKNKKNTAVCMNRGFVRGGEKCPGEAAEVHGPSSHHQHQPHHRPRLSGHHRPAEANVHVGGCAGL